MTHRIIKPLVAMALSFLLVTACNSSAIQTSHQSEQHTAGNPASCQTVQHLTGESCVPINPERVVVISFYGLLSNVLTLGVKPVGSSANTLEELSGSYLSENENSFLGEKVRGIQHIGLAENPSLEKISLLKPDLILAWEASRTIYPSLAQIAPTVIIPSFKVRSDKPDWEEPRWKAHFNYVAEVLGKETVAQQLWRQYDQSIEEVKVALGDRYQNQTISVGSIAPSEIYVLTKNSFPGSVLDEVGLKRPEIQDALTPSGGIGIFNISEERLDILDGDVLFLLYTDDYGEIEAYEKLKQKPLWKQLKAVQKNQVFLVDFYAWNWNDPSAANVVIDDLYEYLVNAP